MNKRGSTTDSTERIRHTRLIVAIFLTALLVIATITALYLLYPRFFRSAQPQAINTGTKHAQSVPPSTPKPTTQPQPNGDTDESKARAAVQSMSLEQQVGQLVMVPLVAGQSADTLEPYLANNHVGSVLLLGNWNNGVQSVQKATSTLQSYAAGTAKLITATDQEGGLVQHLQGQGFDTIPSGVIQGQMSSEQLEQSAEIWASQLKAAGINVDLAPITDTVTVARDTNAPIGALNRDFGLDASGNASHASAFIAGMKKAGVESTIKHFPGLGSVTGNTDFTDQGILDTTTTLDSEQSQAFAQVLPAHPGMVMMSLATYNNIDSTAPAAFSSVIINNYLRTRLGFNGVVISDSLSAAAVRNIPSDQLGVRLIHAGGDIACLGSLDLVQPVLQGMITQARNDPSFAKAVEESSIRVLTLKYRMGLAQ